VFACGSRTIRKYVPFYHILPVSATRCVYLSGCVTILSAPGNIGSFGHFSATLWEYFSPVSAARKNSYNRADMIYIFTDNGDT
jgi:hypothetical protein